MRSVRISASGGDDDRRRAFPPPRRWWQLCVTPYFATRGRGDMRGVPNRSCTQSPPGGGAGLCFLRGEVCIILCTTWLRGVMTACHHLRGGIFGTPFVVPACRHDPAWRNTGLRTAPTAYRGWKLPRLGSSLRYSRSGGDGILCRMMLLHYDLLQKVCPAPRGGRAPRYILCEAVTSLPLIWFLFRFLLCNSRGLRALRRCCPMRRACS